MLGRRIKRVILTTLAWGGVGVVITLYDHLAYLMFEGTTPYDLGVALQTGVLGALVGGGIGVSLTVFLLRPRGRGHSFLASVAIHTLTYTVTILVMTGALTFVFQSRILGEGLLTERVADASVVYLSGAGPAKFVMVWIIVGGITAVFHALSDHLGPDIFGAFLLGRYRTPRVERRTVMFLDLVGSTTIAERLGNVRYFELLQTLFADMTGPLARRRGHVYQYVGDEVVLTWVGESAFHQDACVACFFDIVEIIERKADVYERAFSVRPRFRAGLGQ